jgi:peptide/nickel transport system substrate-binding protein
VKHLNEKLQTILAEIRRTIKTFSEKERVLFGAFVLIFIVSIIALAWSINRSFLVEIPLRGGSLVEGIVGAPRFINPLLAISDTDRDMSGLLYSGLLRAGASNELLPDMAKSFAVSNDGLTYTFILKDKLEWQDGQPITADDVVFTIELAKDPVLKSPKRANWEGVIVQKVDEKTVTFSLSQPYSQFLENTTMGILPKHIWKNVDLETLSFSTFNIEPIGSGPYKIAGLKRGDSGVPEYYDLKPFKKFALGEPFIENLRIHFYPNEQARLAGFESGEIESMSSLAPEAARTLQGKYRIETSPLPRVFGVFFNQNQARIFADPEVRRALDTAVDKDYVVAKVLAGYGSVIAGPIPPGSLGFKGPRSSEEGDTSARTARAKEILRMGGWTANKKTGVLERETREGTERLAFSIATSDADELRRVAAILKEEWDAIGADVEIKVFEIGDLNKNVIRPRKYDTLLFGEIVGRDPDPFAFWHSSQRNDPGLNIALYANIKVDKLLEQARETRGQKERIGLYEAFQDEIAKDIPAVFIYSPDFIYIMPTKVQGVQKRPITTSAERFTDIYSWFIETDTVWKLFAKN